MKKNIQKNKKLCIDLKWRKLRSKVIFGHPKCPRFFHFSPLFPTFHHISPLFNFSPLFPTFPHFFKIFPTFNHFSPLVTTFSHFSPHFATFSHFFQLFTTFHHFSPLFTTFPHFFNFTPLFPHLTDSMLATCIHVAHNVALYAGDVYTRKYFPAQIRSLLILKFFTEMFLSSVSFAISLCRHLYYFLYRLLLLQSTKYFGNFQSFYKDFANIITQRE